MKNFLKKIKKMLKKIPKYEFGVFFVLTLLWLFSLTDNFMTITIKTNNGLVEGYIDGKRWGVINADIRQIKNLEIDLENHNLPKPLSFKPELLELKFLDSTGKVVYQAKSLKVQLPPNANAVIAEIKLKNCLFAQTNFNRVTNSYYSFLYRPFRERDTDLAYIQNGKYIKEDHQWRNLSLPIFTTVKYILKVIFFPFPYLILAIFLYIAAKKSDLISRLNKIIPKLNEKQKLKIKCFTKIAIPAILVLFFLYFIWIEIKYVEKIPHDPDSVDYLWAAKYLATGRLWLHIPSAFFKAHWEMNNHWISLYNYGHSVILGIGALFGISWTIPPLVGTIFLFLLYIFLKNLTGKTVAFTAVLITFFSPQFQMHAVNFMSHNSAIFLVAFLFYALLKIYRKETNKFVSFLGGLSYCLLFQTRPLTAAMIAPIIILFIFIFIAKKKNKPSNYLFLALGFVLSLLIFFYINYLTYGSVIKTAHNQFNLTKFTWTKSGKTINHGLVDSLSYLLVLRLLIFPGLPNLFTLLIILSIFNKKFWWLTAACLICIFLITLGTATYDDLWGIFLGTRFWHEMLPFVFVLIAVSFDLIVQKFKKIGQVTIIVIFVIVAARGIDGWILGKKKLWENMIYFTPNNISELKGFNYTDARLIKEAKKQNIHQAIIFVKDCGGNWWCYGSVADENSVDLNGDIIWVHDLGPKNKELTAQYPQRKYFIADYNNGTIVPLVLD